jgi:hypothetical protein
MGMCDFHPYVKLKPLDHKKIKLGTIDYLSEFSRFDDFGFDPFARGRWAGALGT